MLSGLRFYGQSLRKDYVIERQLTILFPVRHKCKELYTSKIDYFTAHDIDQIYDTYSVISRLASIYVKIILNK